MKAFLLLCVILYGVCFLFSCAGSPAPNQSNLNMVENKPLNSNVNQSENKALTGQRFNYTIPKSTDKLWDNISSTINEWHPENKGFNSETQFLEIWQTGNGYRPGDFLESGANPFADKLKKRQFFKNCQTAQRLKGADFVPPGMVLKVNDLYNRLYHCDPANNG